MGPNLLCPMHGKREDLDRHKRKLEVKNKELKNSLFRLHQCALPDPYDERDISLTWLIKQIEEEYDKTR